MEKLSKIEFGIFRARATSVYEVLLWEVSLKEIMKIMEIQENLLENLKIKSRKLRIYF